MTPVDSSKKSLRTLTSLAISAVLAIALALGALAFAQGDAPGAPTTPGEPTTPGAPTTPAEPTTPDAPAAPATPAAPTGMDTVSQIMVANSTDHGDYLTDANGRAMYIFLNDTAGVSNCDEGCLQNWPPVLVAPGTDLATLSPDLDASLLSTIETADGNMQLVYNGWPLYYYVGDMAAGDVSGQGVGDVWYLVTPQGVGAGIAAGEPGGGAAPQ